MDDQIKDDVVLEEDLEEVEELAELQDAVKVVEELQEIERTFVMVGEKEYKLVKTGREQARQTSDLLNWLGKYGAKLADTLSSTVVNEDGQEEVEVKLGNTWELLKSIGELATEDALIDLFVVATGCSQKEANEHFDVLTLVDAVQGLLSQDVYMKVFNRFF